jgi:hypothetical protein
MTTPKSVEVTQKTSNHRVVTATKEQATDRKTPEILPMEETRKVRLLNL